MNKVIKVGELPATSNFGGKANVYSPKGIAPTLLANMRKDGKTLGMVPKILIVKKIKSI